MNNVTAFKLANSRGRPIYANPCPAKTWETSRRTLAFKFARDDGN